MMRWGFRVLHWKQPMRISNKATHPDLFQIGGRPPQLLESGLQLFLIIKFSSSPMGRAQLSSGIYKQESGSCRPRPHRQADAQNLSGETSNRIIRVLKALVSLSHETDHVGCPELIK